MTTILCFTKDTVHTVSSQVDNRVNTLILAADGSDEAYRRMQDYDWSTVDMTSRIGILRTPRFEMRVVDTENIVSDPHYVLDEDTRIKWLCHHVCSKYIGANLSDVSSNSGTQVTLDKPRVESLCYLAYGLWFAYRMAEDRLGFPAMAIDKLTRLTYRLKPETLDIALLKRETGLSSLSYNTMTDMLTVTVSDDIFSVKLAVLDAYFGEVILPYFNTIQGRRWRIQVLVTSETGQTTDPIEMTYGELGRLVEQMQSYTRVKTITWDNPMVEQNFIRMAEQAIISHEDDTTCVWMQPDEDVTTFLITNALTCVPTYPDDHNLNTTATEPDAVTLEATH